MQSLIRIRGDSKMREKVAFPFPTITIAELAEIFIKGGDIMKDTKGGLSYSHDGALFMTPTEILYRKGGMSYREVDQLIAGSLHLQGDWEGSYIKWRENAIHSFMHFVEVPKFFYHSNSRVIITTVATDSEDGDEVFGKERNLQSLLSEVLQEAGKREYDWKYILVPIGQSNKYSGFAGKIMGIKRHFTHITIEKGDNDNNKYKVNHYDSKDIQGSLIYDLAPIKQGVESAICAHVNNQNCNEDSQEDGFVVIQKGPQIEFTSFYMGFQGFSDNINCGKYSLDGISDTFNMLSGGQNINIMKEYDNLPECDGLEWKNNLPNNLYVKKHDLETIKSNIKRFIKDNEEKIRKGEDLLKYIYSEEGLGIDVDADDIGYIVYALYAKVFANEKDFFHRGSFSIQDSKRRLFQILKNFDTPYPRHSSHYTGDIEQYGIDFKNGELPFGYQHLLFGWVVGGRKENKGPKLFIKAEEHGTQEWADFFAHAHDYLSSLILKEGRKADMRREKDLVTVGRIAYDDDRNKWRKGNEAVLTDALLRSEEKEIENYFDPLKNNSAYSKKYQNDYVQYKKEVKNFVKWKQEVYATFKDKALLALGYDSMFDPEPKCDAKDLDDLFVGFDEDGYDEDNLDQIINLVTKGDKKFRIPILRAARDVMTEYKNQGQQHDQWNFLLNNVLLPSLKALNKLKVNDQKDSCKKLEDQKSPDIGTAAVLLFSALATFTQRNNGALDLVLKNQNVRDQLEGVLDFKDEYGASALFFLTSIQGTEDLTTCILDQQKEGGKEYLMESDSNGCNLLHSIIKESDESKYARHLTGIVENIKGRLSEEEFFKLFNSKNKNGKTPKDILLQCFEVEPLKKMQLTAFFLEKKLIKESDISNQELIKNPMQYFNVIQNAPKQLQDDVGRKYQDDGEKQYQERLIKTIKNSLSQFNGEKVGLLRISQTVRDNLSKLTKEEEREIDKKFNNLLDDVQSESGAEIEEKDGVYTIEEFCDHCNHCNHYEQYTEVLSELNKQYKKIEEVIQKANEEQQNTNDKICQNNKSSEKKQYIEDMCKIIDKMYDARTKFEISLLKDLVLEVQVMYRNYSKFLAHLNRAAKICQMTKDTIRSFYKLRRSFSQSIKGFLYFNVEVRREYAEILYNHQRKVLKIIDNTLKLVNAHKIEPSKKQKKLESNIPKNRGLEVKHGDEDDGMSDGDVNLNLNNLREYLESVSGLKCDIYVHDSILVVNPNKIIEQGNIQYSGANNVVDLIKNWKDGNLLDHIAAKTLIAIVALVNNNGGKHAVLLNGNLDDNGNLSITIENSLPNNVVFQDALNMIVGSLDEPNIRYEITNTGEQNEQEGTCADISLIKVLKLIEEKYPPIKDPNDPKIQNSNNRIGNEDTIIETEQEGIFSTAITSPVNKNQMITAEHIISTYDDSIPNYGGRSANLNSDADIVVHFVQDSQSHVSNNNIAASTVQHSVHIVADDVYYAQKLSTQIQNVASDASILETSQNIGDSGITYVKNSNIRKVIARESFASWQAQHLFTYKVVINENLQIQKLLNIDDAAIIGRSFLNELIVRSAIILANEGIIPEVLKLSGEASQEYTKESLYSSIQKQDDTKIGGGILVDEQNTNEVLLPSKQYEELRADFLKMVSEAGRLIIDVDRILNREEFLEEYEKKLFEYIVAKKETFAEKALSYVERFNSVAIIVDESRKLVDLANKEKLTAKDEVYGIASFIKIKNALNSLSLGKLGSTYTFGLGVDAMADGVYFGYSVFQGNQSEFISARSKFLTSLNYSLAASISHNVAMITTSALGIPLLGQAAIVAHGTSYTTSLLKSYTHTYIGKEDGYINSCVTGLDNIVKTIANPIIFATELISLPFAAIQGELKWLDEETRFQNDIRALEKGKELNYALSWITPKFIYDFEQNSKWYQNKIDEANDKIRFKRSNPKKMYEGIYKPALEKKYSLINSGISAQDAEEWMNLKLKINIIVRGPEVGDYSEDSKKYLYRYDKCFEMNSFEHKKLYHCYSKSANSVDSVFTKSSPIFQYDQSGVEIIDGHIESTNVHLEV